MRCRTTVVLRWQPARGCSLPRRHYSAPPDPPPILVQSHPAPHSGSIRVLLLNRSSARNALSTQLLKSLSQHIHEIQSENGTGPTRALILGSAIDSAFCAGADLKERKSMSKEETNTFLTSLRNTFTALATLPIPTFTAISSLAFGGGLELALCTSLRVFASTAQVAQPETRLAIIPGAGGTYRLPALVGTTRARDLILTGRRVSGPEAYFMGLCDRLVEVSPEEAQQPGVARTRVLDTSVQLARDICEGGPIAVVQALRAVNGWRRGDEAENEAYDVVLHTEDRLEALKAFGEKRKPTYKGR